MLSISIIILSLLVEITWWVSSYRHEYIGYRYYNLCSYNFVWLYQIEYTENGNIDKDLTRFQN